MKLLAMLAMVFVVDRARDLQEADDGEFEEDVSLTLSRIEEIGACDQDLSAIIHGELGRMVDITIGRGAPHQSSWGLEDRYTCQFQRVPPPTALPLAAAPAPAQNVPGQFALPTATTSKTVQPGPARIFLLEGPGQ